MATDNDKQQTTTNDYKRRQQAHLLDWRGVSARQGLSGLVSLLLLWLFVVVVVVAVVGIVTPARDDDMDDVGKDKRQRQRPDNAHTHVGS